MELPENKLSQNKNDNHYGKEGAVGTPLTPKYGIGILRIRLLGAATDVYSINRFA